MPKLDKLARSYSDLADRFHVIGIHEPAPGESLSALKAAASEVARKFELTSGLLPDMVLDEEQGMFATYNPDGLGDTVLLDDRGIVIACGDAAVGELRRRLDAVRSAVATARGNLQTASSAGSVETAIRELYALELSAANAAVDEFLSSCNKKTAGPTLTAILTHGGPAGLELLGGSRGLTSEDKKRRDAVLSVLETAPQPGFTYMLRALMATPKLGSKPLCRALTTLVAGDPESTAVHSEVLARSEAKDTTVRRCAAEHLGTIGTPDARARLMEILAKDRSAPVRRHAVRGLAKFGDEEAKARITELSTADRAKSVRAVATKALATWK
ncbi:MAG: hypothetical protein GY946_04165 [bacterium]|nr:hypothetical protein [bacterium]